MCKFTFFSQIITTLDIGNNGIGDDGIQHLITALNNNNVIFVSMTPLSMCLFSTQTLTTLNLSGNQIGITTGKYLAQTIGYNTVNLTD